MGNRLHKNNARQITCRALFLYVDLLFYHRGLSCLVVFELKIGKFKPKYVGKMGMENENPIDGIIICAKKDDVVEFALSRSLSSIMLSEYKLKLIDKQLLQNKLKEYVELAESNNE